MALPLRHCQFHGQISLPEVRSMSKWKPYQFGHSVDHGGAKAPLGPETHSRDEPLPAVPRNVTRRPLKMPKMKRVKA